MRPEKPTGLRKVGYFARKPVYFLHDLYRWFKKYLRYRFRPKHPLIPQDAARGEGVFPLHSEGSGSVRVALTGDFADGSDNARDVAAGIDDLNVDYTWFLGDIYRVGAIHEVERNFLGLHGGVAWPRGKSGSLAVPGNHEYQSGAHAFYSHAMPYLGVRTGQTQARDEQTATYFCMENDHWLVIGLDTGYHSVKWAGIEGLVKILNKLWVLRNFSFIQDLKTKLPKEMLAWLEALLKRDGVGDKALIFLSHHQYLTTLDGRGDHPKPGKQIAALVRKRRVLWFQGHGHRLEIHGEHTRNPGNLVVYARTVGNGSETDAVALTQDQIHKIGETGLRFADNRMKDPEEKSGYPGFATLEFKGDEVTIGYHALSGADGPTESVFSERVRSVDGDVSEPEVLDYRRDTGFIHGNLPDLPTH